MTNNIRRSFSARSEEMLHAPGPRPQPVGIASPANAFAAQANEYQWLTSIAAFDARLLFLRLYGREEKADLDKTPTQDEVEDTFFHLGRESTLFRDATPVWVTAEVMDLVNEAVVEMPNEVLLAQDLPMENFILWLEQPLPYHPLVTVQTDDGPEVVTEEWQLDAIAVESVPKGIVVSGDSEMWDNQEIDPTIAKVGLGNRVQLLRDSADDPSMPQARDGILVYGYVSRPNTIDIMGHLEHDTIGPYCLIDMIGVGFDVDWEKRAIDGPARKLHKWLIAMMRLMGEHIELRHAGVGRPLLRSAQRSGRKIPKDGYLSIMHLRSISYGDGEPGESAAARKLRWRHRVRGHWQSFYCSSRKLPVGDPGAYRHRYVNAYVRGPQETPVVESHRMVVVDR